MKLDWAIIRIALALAAIFTLGIVVGRLTTSSESVEPPSRFVDVERASNRVMKRYHDTIGFTDEQLTDLRDQFRTVSRRMEILPKRSRARLAALEDFHEELATHLTEEQKKRADEILAFARAQERLR